MRFLFLLLLCSPLAASAQAIVTGVVTADGEPVPFASLGVRGTTYGTAADLEGRFRLANLPAGTYTLAASAVGYQTTEQHVTLAEGETLRLDFVLETAVIEGEGVTVTGTMVEAFTDESPVKVNVVSTRYLQKVPTANVMDVLGNINGLYQQIDCGVCGTNNIRINGVDGPYTAVLIDGMPIMSSLATVYGLNGISPSLIQQVEVVKGPMSTLYGSEAMGGVINIITKDPRRAPRLAVNAFRTSDAEFAADVGVVPTRGRFATLLSGTALHNDRFVDENGDGFADLVLNTRASLFSKVAWSRPDGLKRADLAVRFYYEDRKGGTESFLRDFSDALRGSDTVYGETIRTNRVELTGAWHLRPETGARLDLAFNHHDQDSYYGAASYQARQTTAFGQFLWPIRTGGVHAFLFGAALRAQRYDDDTAATGVFDDAGNERENRPDERVIPGVFAQHEWAASDAVRLLTGFRVDHQQGYGLIPSPRLSLKWRPHPNTTLRLNGGTGFRIVNLFTEDHAAYSGARATVLLEDLEPERSYSGTLSVQQVVPFGLSPLTIDLDGFWTHFTNKIEPNYDTPGLIVYRNLDGTATTRGVSLSLSQNLTLLPLSYTLGATVMDVFVEEHGDRKRLEFAPAFQGVANATLRLGHDLSLDYTANLTGPMALPEYDPPFERPSSSPTYAVHNLQLTREFHVGTRTPYEIQAYLGVENLLDYTQPSPLVDPAHPFGEHFDTAYVYGPTHGRTLGFGLRVTMVR